MIQIRRNNNDLGIHSDMSTGRGTILFMGRVVNPNTAMMVRAHRPFPADPVVDDGDDSHGDGTTDGDSHVDDPFNGFLDLGNNGAGYHKYKSICYSCVGINICVGISNAHIRRDSSSGIGRTIIICIFTYHVCTSVEFKYEYP